MAVSTLNLLQSEDISIRVFDGTPLSLVLTMEQASLSITGLQQGGLPQEVTPTTRRGKLLALTPGARVFPTVSLTSWMTAVDAAELHNFILRREAYGAGVSTISATGKIFTLNVEITTNESVYGGTDSEITLAHVNGPIDISEEQDGLVSVSWSATVYGDVLVDGSDPFQSERA